MNRTDRIRYGVVVFYSVFSLLISSIELPIVLLPFLVFTEKRLGIKTRIILTVLTIMIMGSVFFVFYSVSYSVFRMYVMVVFFLVFVLFNKAIDREYKHWICYPSILILEFVVVTYLLSVFHSGVVW